MKKVLPYIVGIVIVGVMVGLFWFVSSSQESKSTSQKSSETTESTSEEATEIETNEQSNSTQQPKTNQTYTKVQVATHNTESDCWTIISGSVYDITSYVPRHPGGAEILRACGTDGTSLFTQRTTSDGQAVGSGEPHSSNAEGQLARLKIGTLSQ